MAPTPGHGVLHAMPDLRDLALYAAGFISWAVGTMAAGSSSVLFVAAMAAILHGQGVAPAVTVATMLGSPARSALLWRWIDWRVFRWYAPGAVIGATLGGWLFTRIGGHWVQICVALFLVSAVWQYRAGERARSFRMEAPWFLPVAAVASTISAVVGSGGLMTTPFYLNYGLNKEALLATRAANSLVIQAVKIGAYLTFGALSWTHVRDGTIAGLGGVTAIWLLNPWLHRLSAYRFRQFAVLVMLAGGLLILWQERIALQRLLGLG